MQVGSASSGAASTERLQEIDQTESDKKNTPSISKQVAILAEQSTKRQPHLNPTGATTELPCDASHADVTRTISP